MSHRPLVRTASLLIATLATGTLGGCAWILDDEGFVQDRSDEYREARTTRAPEIPDDLDASAIQDTMFIPEVGGMDRYLAQTEYELPRPATLFTREEDRGVRIQRFEGDSWIVAPDPPATVWPRVKQFLSDNGVAVAEERPGAGLIETGWIELDGDEYRDVVRATLAEAGADARYQRLRLSVEQAVRRGATEIHLRQFGGEGETDAVDWGTGSTDDDAATALLAELAGYLAAEVGGGISFVAQSIATEAKAELIRRRDAPPALRLRLDFPRAWATVATALANASIHVDERDQGDAVYRIRFNEAQFRGDEGSWLSGLFDFGSDDPSAEGDPYTLRLEPVSDGYDVRVVDTSGDPVDRDQGEQILSVLREFAS
jgi:outer membrane protein assembly factor BamC